MTIRAALVSSVLVGFVVLLAGCGGSTTTGPAASTSGPTATGPTATSGGGNYLSAIEKARQKANEIEAMNNLKQIGLALHTYHDANNLFPTMTNKQSGQRPNLSWRVALLPYVEEGERFTQFKHDQPWDSPHNKKLMERMPNVYRNPRFQKKEDQPTLTYFQGFIGDGGVLGEPGGMTLAAITNANGTSNTLMVVEAGEPVPWTKPEDLVHDLKKPLPPLGGPKRGPFFLALFCDGHVQRIPANTPEKTSRCMIQWNNVTPFQLP